MIRRLCTLLLLAASTAQAQLPTGWQDRFDPATGGLLAEQVDSAVRAGLPPAPLVSKALEGAAKKAPPAGIVAAVRALRAQMGQARTALGAAATADEIEAGALSLRAGFTREHLMRFREARPRQSTAFALLMAVDLVTRGVPADAVGATLPQAAGRGSDDALARLRDRILYDIDRGGAPGAALNARLNAFLVGTP